MLLLPAQSRAARALLAITQEELASRCVVSQRTIASFEAEIHRTTAANCLLIRRALEESGVEFLDGDKPGVRLKGPHPDVS